MIVLVTVFFYFHYQVFYAQGENSNSIKLEILKGESVDEIATKLKSEQLIGNKYFFFYYLKKKDLEEKVLPGEYLISGSLTIPEIASIITTAQSTDIKITFPEGWTSKKMAERLTEKGLDGDGFLKLVNNPNYFKNDYSFLRESQMESLEGYLFPDTYFFEENSSAEEIIKKMLDNFSFKVNQKMLDAILKDKRTLDQVIIMASIVEREVNSYEDRELVSGLFWNRIKIGQALQSCATVSFALSKTKEQFSFEDTRVDSPYNTYINRGLPPGAISNPGISAIMASIYPKDSNYNFFLSDPATEKTIFSVTLDEHNANKAKYGL